VGDLVLYARHRRPTGPGRRLRQKILLRHGVLLRGRTHVRATQPF
jgi:hypothetical protein